MANPSVVHIKLHHQNTIREREEPIRRHKLTDIKSNNDDECECQCLRDKKIVEILKSWLKFIFYLMFSQIDGAVGRKKLMFKF
jgi:hypothetical protein